MKSGVGERAEGKIKETFGVEVQAETEGVGKKVVKIWVRGEEEGRKVIAGSEKWVEEGCIVGWWREGQQAGKGRRGGKAGEGWKVGKEGARSVI